MVAEQRLHMGLHAPQRGRLHARWRRHVAPEHLEHAADQAVGRPVGQADAATGSAHPRHLSGRSRMVRREHHAEGRQHGIKAGIAEGQRLDIGDLELHVQVLGARPFGAALEQAGDVIGGRD